MTFVGITKRRLIFKQTSRFEINVERKVTNAVCSEGAASHGTLNRKLESANNEVP